MSLIQLSGIGSGTLNAASLRQGSYAVIYNTDSGQVAKSEIPNCANCACTEDISTSTTGGIKWCTNVVYYGCCVGGSGCNSLYSFENAISECVFNNGLSMTSFTIEILWTNPNTSQQITIQSLTFDTDKQWPTVATEYALELKNKGFNNEFGSAWAMSCDTGGTPGDDYLSTPCSFDCTPAPTGQGYALCDLNGGGHYDINDDEPGCIASTGSCSCETGYYAHYHTCLPLPAPSNCTSVEITLSASSASFLIPEWDGDSTYTYLHCESYPEACVGGIEYASTPTTLLNPIVYDPGREDNATMFTLSAIGTGGDKWFSQRTECKYVTGNPTSDPTPSPTMSVPIVPSCNIALSADLYSFDLQWQAITHVNTSAVDRFDGYVYYFNDIRRSIAAPCCQLNSEAPPGSKIFNLSVDNVSVSADWDSILTDVTSLEELLSATLCTVTTQIPTTTPTTQPTNNPTPAPTGMPTRAPTPAPTLGELYVPACSAIVLQSSTTFDMSWTEANFTASTASKNDTKYKIEWFYNNGQDSGVQIVFADQPPRPIQVNDYLNVTLLQMYCTWSSFTEEGRRTNCSISTLAPTPAPTTVPSTSPTKTPSKSPSKSPTKSPSNMPTASPTYSYDDVSWCHAVFNVQFETGVVTLSWGLLNANDADLETPPSNSISYTGTIGDGTTTIRATHDSAFIKCNETDPTQCWGEVQKALTPNVGGGWSDLSKATFYAEYSLASIIRTSTINCTVDTPEPTASPTEDPSKEPTMSPTLGEVWVYLDNTACQEDRCGCRSTQPSADNPDCCYNACEWDKQPAPIIIVSEKSESNTTFYVRRNIENYPYTIQIEYNITAVRRDIAYEYGFYDRIKQIEAGDYNDVDFLNETLNANDTSNVTQVSSTNISYTIPPDCYFNNEEICSKEDIDSSIDEDEYSLYQCANDKKRGHKQHECSWCDYHYIPGPRCNDISPSGGQFIIPHTDLLSVDGGTFEQATFELSINTEGCTHGCDYKGEVFMLELTKCVVIKNYKNLLSSSQLADLGATPGDILECTLIYPTRAYIIVIDQDVTSIVEEEIIANESYNDWLWYVIGAAVVVLAGLSYVAYIWWRNKKMKEADVAIVEEDMEAVIEEQELGWQADEGVIIAPANPLATIGGVHRPVDTYGAEYNPAANEKIKDVANVGIEKFDERVEYGQQRGGDHEDYGDVV